MEVSSYKDQIIKFLEDLDLEEETEESIREGILKIIGREETGPPVIVDLDEKRLVVYVGVLSFYMKGNNEKERL